MVTKTITVSPIKTASEQAVGMVQSAAITVGVVLLVLLILAAIFKPKMRKFKAERKERERKETKLKADLKRDMKQK
jgi:flagellar biosynthesis/type III secretory pathway M-ring protein FliF/YscJ